MVSEQGPALRLLDSRAWPSVLPMQHALLSRISLTRGQQEHFETAGRSASAPVGRQQRRYSTALRALRPSSCDTENEGGRTRPFASMSCMCTSVAVKVRVKQSNAQREHRCCGVGTEERFASSRCWHLGSARDVGTTCAQSAPEAVRSSEHRRRQRACACTADQAHPSSWPSAAAPWRRPEALQASA